MGPLACRQNVLPEVGAVDPVPDGPGRPLGRFVGEGGVLMKIGLGLLERGGPEEKKPLNVAAANVGAMTVPLFRRLHQILDWPHVDAPAATTFCDPVLSAITSPVNRRPRIDPS